MLMTVFEIHFFIVLPIRLKICRSNVSFLFTRQNVRAQKLGRISEVLRAKRARSVLNTSLGWN